MSGARWASPRPEALVGAALLEPSLAGFVALALDQDEIEGEPLTTMALAVAVLHEHQRPGGVASVISLLEEEWNELAFVGGREDVEALAARTPELEAALADMRARLAALPQVDREPVVLHAARLLGASVEGEGAALDGRRG